MTCNATPRQIESSMTRRGGTPQSVSELYASRDSLVSALRARGQIAPADLRNLDRTGRAKVASVAWLQCTQEARTELLDDLHHFVRACAVVSRDKCIRMDQIQGELAQYGLRMEPSLACFDGDGHALTEISTGDCVDPTPGVIMDLAIEWSELAGTAADD